MTKYTDIGVETQGHVAIVEIQRPPHNFFDMSLITQIADAIEGYDKDTNIRAGVLCAQGKAFCAGANFGDGSKLDAQGNRPNENQMGGHLYQEAVRLFRVKKPIVGAIHGPAIGGGLGLALVPDFRVAAPEARFSANFTRLGFHPGFGLTYTLPRLIGDQQANLMFYTGRRLNGEQALAIGLADVLVPLDEVRAKAIELAQEISESAPLAVQASRATVRKGMADAIKAQTDHELAIQSELRKSEDFKEGVKAVAERRVANFKGR
ncbi:MAG: enoyl-CoA hydratase/isomerase family protein [Hyphomicrobiaceae bacterium]